MSAHGSRQARIAFRRSTAGMAAGTLLSRVTGFGRVFALAYALAFTRFSDAYNLANTTPNIVYELVLGGILSATLVPVFVDRLATDDEEDAWTAISAVVTASVAVLVAITVAFFLAAPWLIRIYTLRLHGTSARDQQAVATALLRMFAPQVLFYGLIALATALLNARRRFAAPMTTPVLNNLLVIGVLLLLPHVTLDLSLHAMRRATGPLVLLGLGTTAGVALQAVALWPSLRGARLRLRMVWQPAHDAVRTVLRLSGWTFGYVVTNQVALWVILVLANARAGDVSAYQAAYLFFLLPHSVFAVSIMTALLPDLSERWSVGDVAGYRERLSFGLRVTALVVLPAAAGLVVLARPIVKLVLLHGALSAHSARTTGDVLALMSIGLPAFSAYLLLMRAYQAMLTARALFVTYCIENGLNVVLGLVLYPIMGVRGLALALALAYVGGTFVAGWDIRRRIGGLDGRVLGRSLVRMSAATAVMAGGVALVAGRVGAGSGGGLVVRVGLAVGVGVALYGALARLSGVPELRAIVRRRTP